MEKEKLWNGEDIYIVYEDVVLMIAAGTGENLEPEDLKQGYVDYFNLELYDRDSFDFDKVGFLDTIGGGFMLRTEPVLEEFDGVTIEHVIESVFEENGYEDEFDLRVTGIPVYAILDEEE